MDYYTAYIDGKWFLCVCLSEYKGKDEEKKKKEEE